MYESCYTPAHQLATTSDRANTLARSLATAPTNTKEGHAATHSHTCVFLILNQMTKFVTQITFGALAIIFVVVRVLAYLNCIVYSAAQ